MSTVMQLAPEWRGWIREKLARGGAAQSLVDDMVRDRFGPAFASAAVHSMLDRMAVAAPVLRGGKWIVSEWMRQRRYEVAQHLHARHSGAGRNPVNKGVRSHTS